VVFPGAITGTPPSIQLGCVRDCLYLVTLNRPDGKPVLARRGALAGGAAPASITLPAVPVPAGSYRFTVRLVTQSNPGPVQLLESEPVPVM
jgi:hypothetical protein